LCVLGTRVLEPGVSVDDMKPFAGTLTSLNTEASKENVKRFEELGESMSAITTLKLIVSHFFLRRRFFADKDALPRANVPWRVRFGYQRRRPSSPRPPLLTEFVLLRVHHVGRAIASHRAFVGAIDKLSESEK